MRVSFGLASRFLHVDSRPVLVRAWQLRSGDVRLRADALHPAKVDCPPLLGAATGGGVASPGHLRVAIERMRFALGLDDDLADFRARFRDDPLLGPIIRRKTGFRPRRSPWPWEALAWAITNQLIEAARAAQIQRRIVARWGPRAGSGREALRDVPCAGAIAGRAPAELEALDLANRRAVAMRSVARAVAAGRCDPGDPGGDERLLAMSNIGPWTVQCLGFFGRGEPHMLPAADLGYIKLVGVIGGLGRRATVEEVEEFFAPYAPYQGLAGAYVLSGLHYKVASSKPMPFVHEPLEHEERGLPRKAPRRT
jgi:3-methyladenine DNA glycosylase/8-oxoguanine DNA glycosylase